MKAMQSSNNQKQSNIFLEHVISSIEKKRRFSIENASKTNLYSNEEFVELMIWFDSIIEHIKLSPPNDYVRTVQVYENEHSQIKSVQYELFEKGEMLSDSELQLFHIDN